MKTKGLNEKVLKIAALYFFISMSYILFADRIAHSYVKDEKVLQFLHDLIGVIFVIFTTVTIYILVYRELKAQRAIGIQLKERNEHFRKIFENAPTGIAMADWDGKFIQCNPSFCSMLGYTEDALYKMQFPSVIYEEDMEENLHETTLLKSGKKKFFELESRYMHKDGYPVWSHKYVTLLPDESGKLPLVLALITDISERKINEQRQKEQQLIFETMFNSIADGMIITNTKRVIIHANRGMKQTFGYAPGELIGHSTEMLYADKKKFEEAGAAVFGSQVDSTDNFFLTHYRDNAGKVFTGETYGAKLYDSAGTWIGNLGIMRDISERIEFIRNLKQSNDELMAAEAEIRMKNEALKKANETLRNREAELENSSRFFEQLLLQSATSTQLFDPDGWCVRINPKLTELFGVQPEEIEGRKYNIFEDEAVNRPGVQEKIKRVFEQFETVTWEADFNLNHAPVSTGAAVVNPQKRHLLNKAYPILDHAGKLENVIVQHEDITEIKEVEHKIMNIVIQTEEQERKRIAQELHDGIGPLLSTVKLYFQTYINSGKEELKTAIRKQLIDTLNEAIDHVSYISNNLSPHILTDFGLKAAITRVLDRVGPMTGIKYSIDFQLPENLRNELEVTLYRVTVELINNTVKHAEARKIDISITGGEECLQLEFMNDGKFFDFERARAQRKGMGLFNIQNRVKSLGGEVKFEADASEGIVYKILLPL